MGPDLTGGAPFGFRRVVFLSQVLGPGTPVFPGDPAVGLTPAASIGRDGYYLQRLTCGEQSGTHWAAPAHFRSDGLSADQLAAADFFFPAVVLDHRVQAAADADFAVAVSDVERWEAAHGEIPRRAAVLLRSGYDERWGNPPAYLGTDDDGRLHYPGFSGAAAEWLIERRGIGALGTDTMGIDPGADTAFAANSALLGGHRIHLENLRGLAELPAAGAWLIVGGIRTLAGSGSPATVFGLIP
jgi:kynurenine formamidase